MEEASLIKLPATTSLHLHNSLGSNLRHVHIHIIYHLYRRSSITLKLRSMHADYWVQMQMQMLQRNPVIADVTMIWRNFRLGSRRLVNFAPENVDGTKLQLVLSVTPLSVHRDIQRALE